VSSESTRIAYEILAYLIEHPDSSDTVDGIIEWWLLERKIEYQTAQVKEALIDLVDKGWLVEDKRMNSRTHYRLNQHKHGEIRTLLNQQSYAMGRTHGSG
jgi:hypothetical protein